MKVAEAVRLVSQDWSELRPLSSGFFHFHWPLLPNF